MKEKQRITITGRYWEDIIKLPCFYRLVKIIESYILRVHVQYADGEPVSPNEKTYGLEAIKGDTLVEYDNGEWGLDYGEHSEQRKKDSKFYSDVSAYVDKVTPRFRQMINNPNKEEPCRR